VQESTLGLLPNPFDKNGIKFAVTYIGEVLGNPTGGAKQRAVYEDRINFAMDIDLQKMVGLNGLTFHANFFRIDGGGLSRGSLLNFLDVSGIEALPTTVHPPPRRWRNQSDRDHAGHVVEGCPRSRHSDGREGGEITGDLLWSG